MGSFFSIFGVRADANSPQNRLCSEFLRAKVRATLLIALDWQWRILDLTYFFYFIPVEFTHEFCTSLHAHHLLLKFSAITAGGIAQEAFEYTMQMNSETISESQEVRKYTRKQHEYTVKVQRMSSQLA